MQLIWAMTRPGSATWKIRGSGQTQVPWQSERLAQTGFDRGRGRAVRAIAHRYSVCRFLPGSSRRQDGDFWCP